MTKQELKQVVNKEFGFAMNKIVLLEAGKDSCGRIDYIMFEVCGIEYQMNYSYTDGHYKLGLYESHGRIEW